MTFLKPFLGNLWNNNTYFGTKLDQSNRKKGLSRIIQAFQTIFPEVQALAPPSVEANRYLRYHAYSKLESVGFGREGVPMWAVQIGCTVDDETSNLTSSVKEDIACMIFLVYHQGRCKEILQELVIEEDNPKYVHGNRHLQAYHVHMMTPDIEADIDFLIENLVCSLVLLQYSPPNNLMSESNNDEVHYWLWTEDRKVLVGGCFDFPSNDIRAFTSETGQQVSTWNETQDTQNNIVGPASENNEVGENGEPDDSENTFSCWLIIWLNLIYKYYTIT